MLVLFLCTAKRSQTQTTFRELIRSKNRNESLKKLNSLLSAAQSAGSSFMFHTDIREPPSLSNFHIMLSDLFPDAHEHDNLYLAIRHAINRQFEALATCDMKIVNTLYMFLM